MLHKLEPGQYANARPLFAELANYQLCVEAALAGTSPGQVWADNPECPQTALVRAIEGDFVAGYAGSPGLNAALRAQIPYDAELYVHPPAWEDHLAQIWSNPMARQQARRHYLLTELRLADWRARIPAEFTLVRVDEDFLARTDLENYDEVAIRVRHHWHAPADFLGHGFGFCLLHGEIIVTRCLSDCVVGHRCEMGIGTDPRYRRQGLAALTVAATVEHCLTRGLNEIGWHCLDNNVGSYRVAEWVGFERERDYAVWSAGLPAENAGDLSPEQWRQWAHYYERAPEQHALDAACCWALSGNAATALALLHRQLDQDWRPDLGRLRQSWIFAGLHGEPAWQAFIRRVERLLAQENSAG
jgi:RimJ/RimL family protein N-acetyltransferase